MRDTYSSTDFAIYDDLSSESIEALKCVLEIEHERQFTLDEVREIATGLLKLFEALADHEDVKEEVTQEEIHESLGSTQLSLIY